MPLMAVWRIARNRLGTNLTKWSNTFKEFIDNSLSVSDHFVRLALKRLTGILIFLSNKTSPEVWNVLTTASKI